MQPSKGDEQMLRKGQQVEYNFIWAGGSDPDPSKHLRDWFPGYVVVEPVSPYAKGCALIKRENGNPNESRFWGVPFNAKYEDIRPLTTVGAAIKA